MLPVVLFILVSLSYCGTNFSFYKMSFYGRHLVLESSEIVA